MADEDDIPEDKKYLFSPDDPHEVEVRVRNVYDDLFNKIHQDGVEREREWLESAAALNPLVMDMTGIPIGIVQQIADWRVNLWGPEQERVFLYMDGFLAACALAKQIKDASEVNVTAPDSPGDITE